jgi:hypothetical protein
MGANIAVETDKNALADKTPLTTKTSLQGKPCPTDVLSGYRTPLFSDLSHWEWRYMMLHDCTCYCTMLKTDFKGEYVSKASHGR